MASTTTRTPARRAINPMDNPEKANAEIAKLLADSQSEVPEITPPPADLVTMPGGLMKGSKLVRTATVRELTGEHEEALSRASQSLNPFHFIDTLLRCGVKQIGDLPEAHTESLLRDLLIGDREFLILEIRRATYGDEIEVEKWTCPQCEGETTLKITLDEIPVREMDNPETDQVFDVKLRKGRKAHVRLGNGHDQTAMFENTKHTQAERDSILLSKTIQHVTNEQGMEISTVAFPAMARQMSIPDRRAILTELAKRQPGPRYNEVKFKHDDCGEDVELMVGIGDLFLGIGY
jgi:hypothetical protein